MGGGGARDLSLFHCKVLPSLDKVIIIIIVIIIITNIIIIIIKLKLSAQTDRDL